MRDNPRAGPPERDPSFKGRPMVQTPLKEADRLCNAPQNKGRKDSYSKMKSRAALLRRRVGRGGGVWVVVVVVWEGGVETRERGKTGGGLGGGGEGGGGEVQGKVKRRK